MNERLRLLVELAYEYSDIPNTDGVFNKEKFAELIVRECALLCNDPVVVLQHFGIDSDAESVL